MTILFIGILAPVISYFGVGLLRRWAERQERLDVPNGRSSHTVPTPHGGGLVIVMVTTVGIALALFWNPAISSVSIAVYLVAAWLIARISWLDDQRPLPNRLRFAVHSLAALLIILVFGYWHVLSLPVFGNVELGWLGLLVTFFWVVGLTNAYNFMDGIDGIAGGQAVVAGIGWAIIGGVSGNLLVGVLGILVAASSLGFLGHNWSPARIFMGDVGSAFLGFTFATLAVVAAQSDPRLALVGLLLVWPFVFDSGITFLLRLHKGEDVFAAHRSHLYQRLVIAGYSHRFVSLLYVGLACVGMCLAVIWLNDFSYVTAGTVLIIPILCIGLLVLVARTESRSGISRSTATASASPPTSR